MTRARLTPVALALVLVATAILSGAAVSTAAESGVVTIDDDHALTTNHSIDAYQETGVATASLVSPHVKLTMAKSSTDVTRALDIPYSEDARMSYLQVEYDSEKPVTLRVYIPREYEGVYIREGVQVHSAGGGGDTADVSVAGKNNQYLSVTVEFEGEGVVAVPISPAAASHYETVTRLGDRFGGLGVADQPSWEYAPSTALEGGNATYAIQSESPSDVLVEYCPTDAECNPESDAWTTVPPTSSASPPVYRHRIEGVNATYIVSETETAPDIRYKTQSSPLSRLSVVTDSVSEIVSQIQKDIEGLLGRL